MHMLIGMIMRNSRREVCIPVRLVFLILINKDCGLSFCPFIFMKSFGIHSVVKPCRGLLLVEYLSILEALLTSITWETQDRNAISSLCFLRDSLSTQGMFLVLDA